MDCSIWIMDCIRFESYLAHNLDIGLWMAADLDQVWILDYGLWIAVFGLWIASDIMDCSRFGSNLDWISRFGSYLDYGLDQFGSYLDYGLQQIWIIIWILDYGLQQIWISLDQIWIIYEFGYWIMDCIRFGSYLDIVNLDIGLWIAADLDEFGYWIMDCIRFGSDLDHNLDIGLYCIRFGNLDIGLWIAADLDHIFGLWIAADFDHNLDIGLWILDYGLQQIWIIFGLWIAADLDHNLDIGLWIAADLDQFGSDLDHI